VAAAYLRGGRLSCLASLRVRHLWLLGVAALVHLGTALTKDSVLGVGARFPALMVAYGLVALWLFLNRSSARGLSVVALGWLLNLTVIAANHGMPVSANALQRAGVHTGNLTQGNLYKHVPMTSDTRLHSLGDAVPVIPLGIVVSAGDVLLALGLAAFVYSGMRAQGSGTFGSDTTPSRPRISSLSRARSSDMG
jgi:Family of unknown function (DUF5317)